MPGTNLTRDEAQQRAATISTTAYDVQLDLTLDAPDRFGTITTIHFAASAGGATFADLVDADIRSLTLNGKPVDASAYADSRIALTGLAEDNELRVEATCLYSHSGEGLHKFVDPVDEKVYLYTQFEVPDARRVFTTFEQPDLKAVFTFHVTAPDDWAVVSNSPTPEPVPAHDGAATWHFEPTKTMSTYITAIVAGHYHSVSDTYSGDHGEIPLNIYCRQSLVEHLDADDIFLITKQGFEFFERTFQMAYPFGGTYDQLFVPEYNMGAMENAGCVTFRDEMIFRSRQTQAAYESRSNTILHEMAHMWFGDLVTMKWWDDLWLNESFAEFAASHANVHATRFTEAWTSFTNSRKNWAYRQDQLPSTHPIAADNYDLHAVEANFDGITYAKGASALKQLVAWVGEQDFFAGLRSYFDKHAFGNTELSDLLTELEAASGRELGAWSKEWLQTSGVNTLQARFETAPGDDGDEVFTSFSVEQTAAEAYPTLRRHRIAIGLYDRVEGRLVRTARIETDVRDASTDIAELIGQRRPDLILLNDDDLTYAKIRLDERSFATLLESIATFEESLPRALCWGSAWDMTRDAELSSTDFVSLVLAGVATESDLTAVGSLLRQGSGAINFYTPDADRPAQAQRWESGLRALVDAADPGSDHQLALVRAFATAASGPERLREILDGALTGLQIDADLRWSLITALARVGAADEAEIEKTLAADSTISGQERASAARAIRPLAEAKSEAWRIVVEDDTTPNETRRQTAFAFQVSGQAELLEPYVDRYLQMAETIIEDKGVWIGQNALTALFPSANPSADALAKVDAWLETTEAGPTSVRYVSEGRDDLARALRAQHAAH